MARHNKTRQDMFYNDSETIFGKPYPDWLVKWWQSWGYADWRKNRGDSWYQLKCRMTTLARTDVI